MTYASQTTDAIRLARAFLTQVVAPDATTLAAVVADLGPVEAAERIRSGDIASSIRERTSSRQAEDLAHRDLERIAMLGGRLVTPEDEDEWPTQQFAALSQAARSSHSPGTEPLALWVLGPHKLSAVLHRAVAVVGTRTASGYGQHVAAEFAHGLAQSGVTVVAASDYGIAGAAHRGALGVGGITLAALPCGVDTTHPAGHKGLLDKIAKEGILVSEYAPGTTPTRHRALLRNRILAALAAGTVVVEAGPRSGAKATASITLALGRVLMAVPGPVTSATSIGCHELMRNGSAVPVCTVAQIMESVAHFGDTSAAKVLAVDDLVG